jgi:hypothetical protein
MKTPIALGAALAVALLIGCSTMPTQSWEYRSFRATLDKPFIPTIDELGTEGWELVSVSEGTAYFKRPRIR